jgi:hypothetical protein
MGQQLRPDRDCGETRTDAPWVLRDPDSWSTDCRILPWTHIPVIAANISFSVTARNNPDFAFPGDVKCGKGAFYRPDLVIHRLDSISVFTETLILFTGDAMYHSEQVGSDALASNKRVITMGGNLLSDLNHPLLCIIDLI